MFLPSNFLNGEILDSIREDMRIVLFVNYFINISSGPNFQGRNRRGDGCDRGRTYIFRYLNPIPTGGQSLSHHGTGRTKHFLEVTSLILMFSCHTTKKLKTNCIYHSLFLDFFLLINRIFTIKSLKYVCKYIHCTCFFRIAKLK